MNPDDMVAMAKEIYIRGVVHNPDWDKQKIAREAIESATQFFLALQFEKGHSEYLSGAVPESVLRAANPMPNMLPSQTQHLAAPSVGSQTQTGNQMAAGRGMVLQRHSGLGMG